MEDELTATYPLIYADPPWKFRVRSVRGMGRSAEAWYDCMTIEQITSLPVVGYAARDCVLLLWVTDPFLAVGMNVIRAWGFTYKTVGFYWMKEPLSWFGTGYWTRANPEQCLLATRGAPKRLDGGVPKLIVAPRREHSRKPDETYGRIERLCAGPYLELFARHRREGWEVLHSDEADAGSGARRWGARGGPG